MGTDYDRIEREILIAAPPDRVWAVITAPQMWLGPDHADPAGFDLREGAQFAFQGNYPMHIERIQPNRYLAFRWANRFPPQQPREGNSTLVEYTLAPEADGTRTRLRVVESGFASLTALPEDERRQAAKDNTGAWDGVLDHVRNETEQPPPRG